MTYQMSQSIASLAASLAKAQGELTVAGLNADNPFFKSKYADLGSVWDACRGALSKNGLSVIQCPAVSENGDRVDLTTVLAHSSGEWMSSVVSSYIGNNQKLSHAQAIGSIITYLRRYSLASMVGVYAGDDNDGNEDAPKPRQPYAQSSHDANGIDPDETTRRKFHALGVKVYGDAWDDKRAELVASVTKNRTRSSNDLTAAEMVKLITGIEAKIPADTEPPAWDELPSASA